MLAVVSRKKTEQEVQWLEAVSRLLSVKIATSDASTACCPAFPGNNFRIPSREWAIFPVNVLVQNVLKLNNIFQIMNVGANTST